MRNMNHTCICPASSRGGWVMIHNNYQYRRQKTTLEKMYWRCSVSNCPSTLHSAIFDLTNEDAEIYFEKLPSEHNHAPTMELIEKAKFIKKLKQEIQQDPTSTPYELFMKGVEAQNVDDDNYDVPTFSSVLPIIKRKRKKELPPVPANIDEVQFSRKWRFMSNNEKFLYYHNNDWGIAIWATQSNIDTLLQCNTIMIDGTFKTCPSPFQQFVTIHADYLGHVIPFVYILLRDKKTTAIYSKVFRVLKQKTHHHFRPQNIISDFENGIIAAVEIELPNTHHHCCLFHLTSNIWKHVQRLGLSGHYMTDNNLKHNIRKLMALPFIPLLLIRNCFANLKDSADSITLRRQYPSLRQLYIYFENNYINGQFPPNL